MTIIPDPIANRKSSDRIISVVSWLSNDTLFAISLNRVQNKADFQRCEIMHTGKVSCHMVSIVLERVYLKRRKNAIARKQSTGNLQEVTKNEQKLTPNRWLNTGMMHF